MIGVLALLAMISAQKISPDAEARARAALDPERLAAARRLRVANGSDASLGSRVREAATRLVAGEMADCLDLAMDLPRGRRPDCTKVAARQRADETKLPTAIPMLIEQMQVAEDRAYAERFTVGEMDTVTNFFHSPIWQTFNGQIDAVNQEATDALRDLLRTTLDGTPSPAQPLETKP